MTSDMFHHHHHTNNGFYLDQHHMDHQEFLDDQDQNSNGSDVPQAPVKREKRKYRCRKRSPATIERAKVVRRDKANARERRRMNSLNDALEHLRTILPALPDEPKMTKIETLRKAQEYIAQLSFQLSGNPSDVMNFSPSYSSCSSSLQSTPFQSPCFPPAAGFQQDPQSQQFYQHYPKS